MGRKRGKRRQWEDGEKRRIVVQDTVETAGLNGVDPRAWLTDILGRIADHNIICIGELLPWRYAEASAVQPHRSRERVGSPHGDHGHPI